MIEADTTLVEGSKRCSHCRRVKAMGAFYRDKNASDGHAYWCKVCCRIGAILYRQTEEYRVKRLALQADPEFRATNAACVGRYRRRHRDKIRRDRARLRGTVNGRLRHCLCTARRRLRQATDPERIRRLEELIAAYTREIERIDAAQK